MYVSVIKSLSQTFTVQMFDHKICFSFISNKAQMCEINNDETCSGFSEGGIWAPLFLWLSSCGISQNETVTWIAQTQRPPVEASKTALCAATLMSLKGTYDGKRIFLVVFI